MFLVALAVLVLVAGTAMPVIGETQGEDSDDVSVDITVEGEDPEISIESYKDSINYNEDQVIEIRVETSSEDDAVDDVEVEIEYTDDGAPGDATVGPITQSEYDPDAWDEGVYTDTFTFSDDLWRYADRGWTIEASVIPEDGFNVNRYYASYSVNEFVAIESLEGGQATGNPGETLSGDDFRISDEDSSQPEITVISNSEYTISCTDGFTVVHSDDDSLNIDGSATYDDPSLTPSSSETFSIIYEVEIPYGQEAGTYSTDYDGGSLATHVLSNSET